MSLSIYHPSTVTLRTVKQRVTPGEPYRLSQLCEIFEVPWSTKRKYQFNAICDMNRYLDLEQRGGWYIANSVRPKLLPHPCPILRGESGFKPEFKAEEPAPVQEKKVKVKVKKESSLNYSACVRERLIDENNQSVWLSYDEIVKRLFGKKMTELLTINNNIALSALSHHQRKLLFKILSRETITAHLSHTMFSITQKKSTKAERRYRFYNNVPSQTKISNIKETKILLSLYKMERHCLVDHDQISQDIIHKIAEWYPAEQYAYCPVIQITDPDVKSIDAPEAEKNKLFLEKLFLAVDTTTKKLCAESGLGPDEIAPVQSLIQHWKTGLITFG